MADNRTMAQMLQAPIEGYEDAIVIPPINANNFELKQPLINLVQSNKRESPRLVRQGTSKINLTWEHLVSKFINQFFPPSKTTYLRNKITNFFQEPNETFNEAWERFKGLLRQCPHHGFSELHQLDTFYNSLNSNDQDALDSAAGGNFLDKMPQEGLAIIESKSKVRYSRSRANDSRVSTDAPLSNSSPSNNSFDMQQIAASLEDKMTIKMNQMMNQMKALVVTPAPVKAVEEGDILILEALLNNDPLPHPNQGDYSPGIQKDLKVIKPQKSSLEYATLMNQIENSPKLNLKSYPPHLEVLSIPIDPKDQEKTTFNVPIRNYVLYLDIRSSKKGIEVDKAKVDVISKLPHPTTVRLRQRIEKHFNPRPIHYASKTMTEAESNYTTTEKEMLAVVYRRLEV
ncbi:reverse transcriptase domain-containing protein [Tanacetum coccineum]